MLWTNVLVLSTYFTYNICIRIISSMEAVTRMYDVGGAHKTKAGEQIAFFWEVLREVRDFITQLAVHLHNTPTIPPPPTLYLVGMPPPPPPVPTSLQQNTIIYHRQHPLQCMYLKSKIWNPNFVLPIRVKFSFDNGQSARRLHGDIFRILDTRWTFWAFVGYRSSSSKPTFNSALVAVCK